MARRSLCDGWHHQGAAKLTKDDIERVFSLYDRVNRTHTNLGALLAWIELNASQKNKHEHRTTTARSRTRSCAASWKICWSWWRRTTMRRIWSTSRRRFCAASATTKTARCRARSWQWFCWRSPSCRQMMTRPKRLCRQWLLRFFLCCCVDNVLVLCWACAFEAHAQFVHTTKSPPPRWRICHFFGNANGNVATMTLY